MANASRFILILPEFIRMRKLLFNNYTLFANEYQESKGEALPLQSRIVHASGERVMRLTQEPTHARVCVGELDGSQRNEGQQVSARFS